MKTATVILLLLLTLVLHMAFNIAQSAQKANNVIEAEKFVLRDRKGLPVAALALDNKDDQPALAFFDNEGKPSLLLGINSEGRPSILLRGRKDRLSVQIAELNEGSFSIWLSEREGDAKAALTLTGEGMALLQLQAREGKGSLQMLCGPGKGPSFVLSDPANIPRLTGRLRDEGDPELSLSQPDGRNGVLISLFDKNARQLTIINENGAILIPQPKKDKDP